MSQTFEEYLAEIDALALKNGACDAGKSYTSMTGAECWRDSYDDGLTSKNAWSKEECAAITMLG